jgi:hypothetical protein
MFRILCPALLVLVMASQARADDELKGIWRNTLEESGVSYWELAPKKGGEYHAQEVGLGGRYGIAKFKDGVLTIEFKAEDHKGVYEWNLKGPVGQGNYTQTHTDGQVLKLKTSIRFIGK